MRVKYGWADVMLFNFCVVSFLGFVLRSKILFSIPFLDYNRLLDAHFHFAFAGWVTLSLAVLFVQEILPPEPNAKAPLKWALLSLLAVAWLLLFTSPLPANSIAANLCFTAFILVTYLFAWFFISGVRQTPVSRTVKLLSISALLCMVISSAGTFYLAYLFASKSPDMFAYRDALYTYLHFQYNGFFTLAVFAILLHGAESGLNAEGRYKAHQFSVWLVAAIIPSLFLTFLWRNPNLVFHLIAAGGSIMLLFSLFFFLIFVWHLRNCFSAYAPYIRNMLYLSLASFAVKLLLQSGTLFPVVGRAVFGDRPAIIGFLHLVFLGFVTLFLMAWLAHRGFLAIQSGVTRLGLTILGVAIVLNELVLMSQGLGAMFILSSALYPWLLWGISLALFTSAVLIFAGRHQAKKTHLFQVRL